MILLSQPQAKEFLVGDNPDKQAAEILIERKFNRYTMFWAVTFEELEALHTAIGNYIAGERERRDLQL